MSRHRDHPLAGTSRYFIAHDPNEKARLSEFINGIKQYQDMEFKSMRTEFDRVERLIASDKNQNAPMQMKDQPHYAVKQKGYRYARWMLMFFLILFFVVAAKLCVGRLVIVLQHYGT